MLLARRLFPRQKVNLLQVFVDILNVKNSKKHRAVGDAEATAKILIKMIPCSGMNMRLKQLKK
jgi:DNA polymerase III alpha subunit (gram-positive type)